MFFAYCVANLTGLAHESWWLQRLCSPRAPHALMWLQLIKRMVPRSKQCLSVWPATRVAVQASQHGALQHAHLAEPLRHALRHLLPRQRPPPRNRIQHRLLCLRHRPAFHREGAIPGEELKGDHPDCPYVDGSIDVYRAAAALQCADDLRRCVLQREGKACCCTCTLGALRYSRVGHRTEPQVPPTI